MNRNFIPDDLITLHKFAQDCGVKDVTVRAWIKRGKIMAYKIGFGWFIPVNTPQPEDKRFGKQD
jgi:hypothetical protein